MEDWEKRFVEMPLRWGRIADPSRKPPDKWAEWLEGDQNYAEALFRGGPGGSETIGATEIGFTPTNVWWLYAQRAGSLWPTHPAMRGRRHTVPEGENAWMVWSGYWSKDYFLRLVRDYVRNMRHPVRLDSPKLATLANSLMHRYLHATAYVPHQMGAAADVVPTYIRDFLGQNT
jgi:hypothetical protein